MSLPLSVFVGVGLWFSGLQDSGEWSAGEHREFIELGEMALST